jgi:hypothetical protein
VLHVRGAGVGCVADPDARVLGDASRRGGDPASVWHSRCGDRHPAAPARYSWEDESAGSAEWARASADAEVAPFYPSSASRRRAPPSARPTESAPPAHALCDRGEMVIRWA